MATLKDSGSRREFKSGAVRDVTTNKGRCDLLPLDVITNLLAKEYAYTDVLDRISKFMETKNEHYLYQALLYFQRSYRNLPDMVLELAKHYEDGCQKYGERNWEKGIPLHCYIDSGVRHYLKWLRGDDDEPHDRAFVWNIVGAIWTLKHRPECIDLWSEDNDKKV